MVFFPTVFKLVLALIFPVELVINIASCYRNVKFSVYVFNDLFENVLVS